MLVQWLIGSGHTPAAAEAWRREAGGRLAEPLCPQRCPQIVIFR
ncbi:hypothetical protein J2S43_007458 [Catenuloplanes nepalensis]|uniref:Uncharacterized protein n=1 Tax=Catenuloplanes nepalensis TaxID=587533 RepID=A0ABT9N685_9ACTN|nr:hypothetical protein [Catenuloplanes nepalensis]